MLLIARLALMEMLPEYKAYWEEKLQSGSQAVESSAPTLSEEDLAIFRSLAVTDKQVYNIVSSKQLNCAAPYTIFGEYMKRHCIPEGELLSQMNVLGKDNHTYEIGVGEHHVQVTEIIYNVSTCTLGPTFFEVKPIKLL